MVMMGMVAHGTDVGTQYKVLNYLDPGGLDTMNLTLLQSIFS